MNENLNNKLVVVTALGAAGIAAVSSETFMAIFGDNQRWLKDAFLLTTSLSFFTLLSFGIDLAFGKGWTFIDSDRCFKITMAIYYLPVVLMIIFLVFAPKNPVDWQVVHILGWPGYGMFQLFVLFAAIVSIKYEKRAFSFVIRNLKQVSKRVLVSIMRIAASVVVRWEKLRL